MNNKKALLIGINYYNTANQLAGCQNDVDAIAQMLVGTFQFKLENIYIMKDREDDPEHQNQDCPTKNNILAKMKELISNAKPGDELYLHYSGHGSTTIDLEGDEKDICDETIVAADMKQIVDDELSRILVYNLPEGVKLRAVFDSCHSGSVLDMPYIYDSKGAIRIENKQMKNTLAKNGRRINAMMISGCQDDQTSEDAYVGGDVKFEGAMTWGLLQTLREHGFLQTLDTIDTIETHDTKADPKTIKTTHSPIKHTFTAKSQTGHKMPTWRDLITHLRKHLEENYSQVPQISFCHKDQLDQPLDF